MENVNRIHRKRIASDVAVVAVAMRGILETTIENNVPMTVEIHIIDVSHPTIGVIVVLMAAVIVVTLIGILGAVHLPPDQGDVMAPHRNVYKNVNVNIPAIVNRQDVVKVVAWKRDRNIQDHDPYIVMSRPKQIFLPEREIAFRDLVPGHRDDEVWNVVNYYEKKNLDQNLPFAKRNVELHCPEKIGDVLGHHLRDMKVENLKRPL